MSSHISFAVCQYCSALPQVFCCPSLPSYHNHLHLLVLFFSNMSFSFHLCLCPHFSSCFHSICLLPVQVSCAVAFLLLEHSLSCSQADTYTVCFPNTTAQAFSAARFCKVCPTVPCPPWVPCLGHLHQALVLKAWCPLIPCSDQDLAALTQCQ